MSNKFFVKKKIKIGYFVNLDCNVKALANKGASFLKVEIPDDFDTDDYRKFLIACINCSVVPVITVYTNTREQDIIHGKLLKLLYSRVDDNIIFELHNDIGILIEKYVDGKVVNLMQWGEIIRICKKHLSWCDVIYAQDLTEDNIMCSITEGFSRKTGEQVRIRTSDSMAGSVNGELNPVTWKETHVKKDMQIILNYYDINSLWDLHGNKIPPMKRVNHFTRAIFKQNSKQFSFQPGYKTRTKSTYLEIGKKIKGRLPKGIVTGACIFADPSISLFNEYKTLYGKYPDNYKKFDDVPTPTPLPDPPPTPEPPPIPEEDPWVIDTTTEEIPTQDPLPVEKKSTFWSKLWRLFKWMDEKNVLLIAIALLILLIVLIV